MKIVKGIQNIIENKQTHIELGNIESKRDWGHARDYVYGMWLMLQQENAGDYVLATGKTYTIKEFVEKSFEYKGYHIKWKGQGEDTVGVDQNDVVRIKINPLFIDHAK